MSLFREPMGFGIDISDFSLKIIGLEKRKGGLFLNFVSNTQIPAGIIEAGQIKKEKELAGIIQKAGQATGGRLFKNGRIAASLPEEKSFLDILTLPPAEDKELFNLVKFEAANHIPVSIDEVYFDFEKIETEQILFSACPKALVESYSRVLKEAGLKPIALEGEAMAMARAIVKKKIYYKPILIVDFGQSQTTFLAYSGSSLKFTSTIPLSSTDFTTALKECLKISLKEAEEIKIKEGLNCSKQISAAFSPLLGDLTKEIKNCLDYCEAHISKDGFSRASRASLTILLCGGGANLKGLSELLTAKLQMKVDFANPLVNIKQSQEKGAARLSSKEALSYATAVGLALKTFYD